MRMIFYRVCVVYSMMMTLWNVDLVAMERQAIIPRLSQEPIWMIATESLASHYPALAKLKDQNPMEILVPLDLLNEDRSELEGNVFLPFSLLFKDKCLIDTYLNKVDEGFCAIKASSPFLYKFDKPFVQSVVHKVHFELSKDNLKLRNELIELVKIVRQDKAAQAEKEIFHAREIFDLKTNYKQQKHINNAFPTAIHAKKIEELSLQIAALKKSKEFFVIGCIFLSIFIFFRCDWWSEREVFNF